jgi:hypothetical protein
LRFNVWPITQQFSAANDAFRGTFKIFSDPHTKATAVLLCLNDLYHYKANCNGKRMALQKVFDGLYVVSMDAGTEQVVLEVVRDK